MAEQTKKDRNREKRQFWKSHIEAWENSGLSQIEYCRKHDLVRCRFTYWKRKLDKKSEPVTFVPVFKKMEQHPTPPNNQCSIKLIINRSYQIEIGDGFSPDTLSTLLHTLGGL